MIATLNRVTACPRCGQDLDWRQSEARCGAGHTFPVVRGVGRFLPQSSDTADRTGETFGFQWSTFNVADRPEDTAVFEAKLGLPLNSLGGRLVLDAGCGSGRYARLAGEAGANVVALDLSDAVDKARSMTAHLPNVAVLQGDLLAPPLKPQTFDLVYSIGVLHHTPNTYRAFCSVARLVKPGGYLAVWLYRRNTMVQELINTGVRAVTTRLPIQALGVVARVGALAGGIPGLRHLNKLMNFSAHPRWETRVCDTFDWYAPPYQFHHSEAELLGWFAATGFESVRALPSQPVKGRLYDWAYRRNLLIGSGVNAAGVRAGTSVAARETVSASASC